MVRIVCIAAAAVAMLSSTALADFYIAVSYTHLTLPTILRV